ncbi:hypothetical protein Y032_0105g3664 [Ancylostoma ceylanicum]|uniref:Uncharacterized protein n=1 Tax=Ancylostoma ceylanicum TaxID=53326 RepID=A0A016TFB9_9BILA|nr:hypothetical protein Y032_0105g3664 [Ancylostoma ceylanicum]
MICIDCHVTSQWTVLSRMCPKRTGDVGDSDSGKDVIWVIAIVGKTLDPRPLTGTCTRFRCYDSSSFP